MKPTYFHDRVYKSSVTVTDTQYNLLTFLARQCTKHNGLQTKFSLVALYNKVESVNQLRTTLCALEQKGIISINEAKNVVSIKNKDLFGAITSYPLIYGE